MGKPRPAYHRTKPAQVYLHAGEKLRVAWWDYVNPEERARALLRTVKAPVRQARQAEVDLHRALRNLCSARWNFNSRQGRNNTRELARYLVHNWEQAKAYDAICRLDGDRKATLWLMSQFEAQLPKPDPEEIAEATRQEKEARRVANVKRREAHARAMLSKHEHQLRREIKLVRKWRTKVRYYDRKEEDNGGRDS